MDTRLSQAAQFIPMKQVLNHLASPPAGELANFLQLFNVRRLMPGDYFLHAGEHSSELCFVNSGLLRFFYQTADGKEFNKSFIAENQFAAAYSAFLTHTPVRFSIQALEECQILTSRIQPVFELFDQHRCWERLGRLLAEQLYIKKESREAGFLLDDAATRYRAFQQQYPGMEERIPQYHVASYLGITPVALSRIRKK